MDEFFKKCIELRDTIRFIENCFSGDQLGYLLDFIGFVLSNIVLNPNTVSFFFPCSVTSG